MPAPPGSDDFVGIGGPGEGLWVIVGFGEKAVDGRLEIDDRAAALVAQQPVNRGPHEALLPTPHTDFALACAAHDLDRAQAVGGQEDNPLPPDMPPPAVPVPDDRFRAGTIGGAYVNDDPLRIPRLALGASPGQLLSGSSARFYPLASAVAGPGGCRRRRCCGNRATCPEVPPASTLAARHLTRGEPRPDGRPIRAAC